MLRMLSMQRINSSLYLCTEKPRKIDVDKKSLRFTQAKENTKPIVLIISWFFGTPSQINKYSKLYTDQGMDVLVGQISFTHFLLSVKEVEKFAKNIADILLINEDHYNEIFLHVFSAGGPMWGIVNRVMNRDLNKYGNVPKRIVGQVWDSAAHNNQAIVAIPAAMFPTSKFLRSITTVILNIYFGLNRPLMAHFEDTIYNVRNNLVRSPALLLYSKVDPIGLEEFNIKLAKYWRENGIDVTHNCFEASNHVRHFQKYPDIYLKFLHEHWDRVKLLERK